MGFLPECRSGMSTVCSRAHGLLTASCRVHVANYLSSVRSRNRDLTSQFNFAREGTSKGNINSVHLKLRRLRALTFLVEGVDC